MATYQLIRRLGTGGMAEVYLARAQGAGSGTRSPEGPVALKCLLPALAEDHAVVEAFLREAQLTLSLSHDNVVRTLAVEGGAQPFMVLELVDGENLHALQEAARARGVTLGLGEVCHLVQQVAEGLAHAHAATDAAGAPLHLVHRDVNPSNVLLSSTGEVKLTDFGIAKVANAQGSTQLGRVKGKSGYVAPEQILRGEVDQRSDVFLLGLLLHELLAGRPLFAAPDYFEALRAIAHFDVSALAPLPGVPPSLWQLVVRALAPDPAARFQGARELADALGGFLESHAPGLGRAQLAALFARAFPCRRSLGEDARVAGAPGAQSPLGAGLRAAAGAGAPLLPPLHLLDAALAMLGGAAGEGPALAQLSLGLARRLGADAAEAEQAALVGYAVALAARREGAEGFARPSSATLEALLGAHAAPLAGLIAAACASPGAAPRPEGSAAQALACALAFVEVAGTVRPSALPALRALGQLRAAGQLPAAAVDALAAELLA